jgi:hypothetical protein
MALTSRLDTSKRIFTLQAESKALFYWNLESLPKTAAIAKLLLIFNYKRPPF